MAFKFEDYNVREYEKPEGFEDYEFSETEKLVGVPVRCEMHELYITPTGQEKFALALVRLDNGQKMYIKTGAIAIVRTMKKVIEECGDIPSDAKFMIGSMPVGKGKAYYIIDC